MGKQAFSPLISVVIPTYNRKRFLIEAINSVLTQTYSNCELIIVDDGSSDGTPDLVRAMTDPRIQLVSLPHNGLIGPLRNAGARIGNGEWLAFLDSDDVWMPRKLELQVKALQLSGSECCYTNYELMDETGQSIPAKAGKFEPFSGNIIRQVLTTEAAVCTGALMISRGLFNKIGGFSADPRLMYREDYEMALRLALHAEMTAIPDVLLRVREHTGRGTNSVEVADAHERSAFPYEVFGMNKPGKDLEKIALKQYAKHMMAAAKINFKLGNYGPAYKQLKKRLFGPDR